MSDEKNTGAEASQPEENLDNESEEAEEEESSEEDSSDDIDYKSELERLNESLSKKDTQISKAEHTIEQLKKENKGGLRGDEIQKLIEEEISKRFQGVEKTALESSAQQVASQIGRNDDEANLIMFHYKNSIVPTGNLREDMEMAQVLANRKRIQAELAETRRALQSPKAAKSSSSSNKKTESSAPKLSSQEASFIKNANMKWNSKNNRYEGKYVALQYDNDSRSWQSVRISQD